MSNPYGVPLDRAWTDWATQYGVSPTVAAALLLISKHRPVQEIVAKLTADECEKVAEVVSRWPDRFPPGTLAALNSRSPIAACPQQSVSVSTDRETRQRPVDIASPDTALGAQRPLDTEAKPGNNQAPRQRLARTSPDTLRERQARAISAAPTGLHRTHERRFNSVHTPQTALKPEPASAAGPDRAVTSEKAGTLAGTLAETARRRLIVEDLMKAGLSVRMISGATDIPRSSVHRAMRAVVRAEAKREIAVVELANELLGKRLPTGAAGDHG